MPNNTLGFIEGALKDTTQIALEMFDKVSGTVKGDDPNQVLTAADLAIGKRIIELISENYPDHNIIDEEAGVTDKKSEYTWVIDPIDGTSNFAAGVPTYGIMLGLLHKDQAVAGGISLPAFSEIYLAEKGRGATCNGQPIRVTDNPDLLSVLVAYLMDGHRENPAKTREESRIMGEVALNIRNLRTSGSAFDVGMLAKGKYGAFICTTSKIWDHVAPQIIVEESGGLYTYFKGEPIDYARALERTRENFSVCAAPPKLHKQLQEIINGKTY